MAPEQVLEFYPLLVRLKNAEFYTPQVSLSAVIAVVYPHMTDEKKTELRTYAQYHFFNLVLFAYKMF